MYQIGVSERPRARLKLTAFCTLSRSFSSLIAEAIAASPFVVLWRRLAGGSTQPARGRPRAAGPGRSGASARRAGRRSRRPAGRARTPRPSRLCRDVHRPVTGDPRGPGVTRDRLADDGRPALDELGHARPAGRSGRAPRGPPYRADPGSRPPRSAPARAGSAERCVAVITVCPIPATRAASTSRRPRSSSESTSSRSSSGGVGSSSASASSSDSTASRCSPCEPNWRRSRVAARDEHVVEMRAEACRAALEIPCEPRAERPRPSAATAS